MEKHTPGPWEWQTPSEYKKEAGRHYIVGTNLGGLVGAAMPWATELDTGDFSRVEANARLIAAAPEMFYALLAALPYIETAEGDEAYKAGAVAKITKQIREAIGKVGAK